MFLLTDIGEIPLNKFRASPQYESLYSNVDNSAKSRDLSRMKFLGLVRVYEVNGSNFIEPDYDVLEELSYRLPKQMPR